MSSKLQLIIVLSASTAVAACDRHQFETLVQSEDELAGDMSGPEDDGIVKLKATPSTGADWNCTGTLLAPNLLITARHCITSFVGGSTAVWNCDANGNLISSDGSGQMGDVDIPSNILVYTGPSLPTLSAKGKSIFTPVVSNICTNDIAFVLLDTELDLPIKPIRLYTPTFAKEEYRAVGYGVEYEGPGDASMKYRHTRSGNKITKVGPSVLRPNADPITPRTFQSQGVGLCIGDSGGPALSDNGAVIGIFSELTGSCTAPDTIEIHTQTQPFVDLALSAFQAAGYEPWLEGNSEPGLYGTGGTPGTGGAAATGGSPPTGGAANVTGGATSATGGAVNVETSGGAPLGTGGETSAVVYDQGPAPGGTCACRAAGVRHSPFGLTALALAALTLRRRRRF